jgi:hypothetical protein
MLKLKIKFQNDKMNKTQSIEEVTRKIVNSESAFVRNYET